MKRQINIQPLFLEISPFIKEFAIFSGSKAKVFKTYLNFL